MQVDETYTISDGNGGTVQAKVTEFDRYYVWYKTRRRNKGPWGQRVFDASRKKFKQLIADVKTS